MVYTHKLIFDAPEVLLIATLAQLVLAEAEKDEVLADLVGQLPVEQQAAAEQYLAVLNQRLRIFVENGSKRLPPVAVGHIRLLRQLFGLEQQKGNYGLQCSSESGRSRSGRCSA